MFIKVILAFYTAEGDDYKEIPGKPETRKRWAEDPQGGTSFNINIEKAVEALRKVLSSEI